jgi:hypothetical protein
MHFSKPALLALAFTSLTFTACFDLEEPVCAYRCGSGPSQCPDHYTCRLDGYCHQEGTTATCPFPDGATLDQSVPKFDGGSSDQMDQGSPPDANSDGAGDLSSMDIAPPDDMTPGDMAPDFSVPADMAQNDDMAPDLNVDDMASDLSISPDLAQDDMAPDLSALPDMDDDMAPDLDVDMTFDLELPPEDLGVVADLPPSDLPGLDL